MNHGGNFVRPAFRTRANALSPSVNRVVQRMENRRQRYSARTEIHDVAAEEADEMLARAIEDAAIDAMFETDDMDLAFDPWCDERFDDDDYGIDYEAYDLDDDFEPMEDASLFLHAEAVAVERAARITSDRYTLEIEDLPSWGTSLDLDEFLDGFHFCS